MAAEKENELVVVAAAAAADCSGGETVAEAVAATTSPPLTVSSVPPSPVQAPTALNVATATTGLLPPSALDGGPKDQLVGKFAGKTLAVAEAVVPTPPEKNAAEISSAAPALPPSSTGAINDTDLVAAQNTPQLTPTPPAAAPPSTAAGDLPGDFARNNTPPSARPSSSQHSISSLQFAIGKRNHTCDDWRQVIATEFTDPAWQTHFLAAYQSRGELPILGQTSLVCQDVLHVAEGVVRIDGEFVANVGYIADEEVSIERGYSIMNQTTGFAWSTTAPADGAIWTVEKVITVGSEPCLFVKVCILTLSHVRCRFYRLITCIYLFCLCEQTTVVGLKSRHQIVSTLAAARCLIRRCLLISRFGSNITPRAPSYHLLSLVCLLKLIFILFYLMMFFFHL